LVKGAKGTGDLGSATAGLEPDAAQPNVATQDLPPRPIVGQGGSAIPMSALRSKPEVGDDIGQGPRLTQAVRILILRSFGRKIDSRITRLAHVISTLTVLSNPMLHKGIGFQSHHTTWTRSCHSNLCVGPA
jgi:hypothetical protein